MAKKQEEKTPLTQILVKKVGKGGNWHLASNPDHRIAFQTLGMIQGKVDARAAAGKPLSPEGLEELLAIMLPVEISNAVEASGHSLMEAFEAMTAKTVKATNYSKKFTEADRLARLLAALAGDKTPEQLADDLATMLANHRDQAVAVLHDLLARNGRSPKGGYIRVNASKH